ncbi:exo-alpha-sialidase [Virgibacillus halodenitrificans]|uniref:sialidase family protein n=1 Tax=Virgibacillus halodenitrificans TaxID=1482 RepID=UPI00136EB650|nr:sialidase family protein [Virgibacillus halodenitrificans]MYL46491.1 exo-alpha-sialidase [Virgibacillus halodenitrificans]
MKNVYAIILSVVFFIFIGADQKLVEASTSKTEPIVSVENEQIENGYFTNLNSEIDKLKGLEEGTIVVRFRYTGSSIMSLFSLSNSNLANGHFHLYISPSSIGSENRFQKPREPQENVHTSVAANLKEGHVYTLAMVVDKEAGYKYFLDGELIKKDTKTPRKFLNNIFKPNSAQLGRTERAAGGNNYPFEGDIDFAKIYDKPLSDETLTAVTGVTAAEPLVNPMPDEAYVTDPQSIFYPGFMDSNNYRIPALYYTEKGTLIAGIDRRVENGADSPNNIDAVIRRSFDDGDTWEENGVMVNDYPDQASNIDLAFLQDKSNERIFALVDGFPHGAGLMGGFGVNSYKGTGFKTIDGKKYMFLTDEAGKEYTVRDGGQVYDNEGNQTEYKVDDRRNLYLNGEKIDNIFSKTTPLKPYKTSYLELYYSDDEGETWEGTIDLNDEVKEEWMAFLGTGPGNGIQLTEGEHKGRLVFPVYFLNDNFKQASAVVYSDDNGKTWHRGESPNEGRVVGNGEVIHEKTFNNSAYEVTESQVVEMPDGQLKLFMRNHSGYAQIATSFDGGETWEEEVVTEKDLVAPYSQMSVIRYDGKVDDKEALIFSSANNSASRVDGTVRIGLIEESGTYENGHTKYSIDWKYDQLVKEGHYGYSSLTNLSDGNIGLFYEGTPNTVMDFRKFNTDFVKWEKEKEAPAPTVNSFSTIEKTPNVYRPGETIQVEVTFDSYVMLMGGRSLTGTLDGTEIEFKFADQVSANTILFEGTIPDIHPRKRELDLSFSNNLDIYNVYGKTLDKQEANSKLIDEVRIRANGKGRK